MTRRKHEEDHDNHERWLVSYADFITLLFAFFVVMYAISSVNEKKYQILSESLGAAFGKPPPPPVAHPISETALTQPLLEFPKKSRVNDALKREREQMTTIARNILNALAPLVQEGKVRVTQQSRGITVEINASVLFAPGEARLTPESGAALRAVADVLKDDHHAIQVEGHTDNIPISTAVFPSNWELSAVRASSVVRLFIGSGVDEERLTAVGFGSTQPVGDNLTPEGRLRNRRVQVMILASLPEKTVEVPILPVEPVTSTVP
jgi:chemotaxis protein MotB